MELVVTPTGDVTREVELRFQEGSTNRRITIDASEFIQGAGNIFFDKKFTNVMYIKIGVPSDAIPNMDGEEGRFRPTNSTVEEIEEVVCDEPERQAARRMTATELTMRNR
jgi:hypothetical protein